MDVHSLVVVYGGSLRFYRLTPDGTCTFKSIYSLADCFNFFLYKFEHPKEWKVE